MDNKVITIYGIPNCDTMKKARRWLDENNITHTFHNYRKDGLDRQWLTARIEELGWEQVDLTPRNHLAQAARGTAQQYECRYRAGRLLEQPGMIKRPLLDTGKGYLLGFKAEDWAKALQQAIPDH